VIFGGKKNYADKQLFMSCGRNVFFFYFFYVQQIRSVFEQNKASNLQGMVVLFYGKNFIRFTSAEVLLDESHYYVIVT
jgi:hypothetical protein